MDLARWLGAGLCCQMMAGSAFCASVLVQKTDVRINGEVKQYRVRERGYLDHSDERNLTHVWVIPAGEYLGEWQPGRPLLVRQLQ